MRSNGERIREVVRLKELQHHFISYRSKVGDWEKKVKLNLKVEIAVDALKDIARELHQLEVGAVKKRQVDFLSNYTFIQISDCKTFTTQTFTTPDIHHPLCKIRHSPPQTFTTPFVKSDVHHPRHSPPPM